VYVAQLNAGAKKETADLMEEGDDPDAMRRRRPGSTPGSPPTHL